MRTNVLLLVMLLVSLPASAQSVTPQSGTPAAGPECRPFDTPPLVVMTMTDGRRVRGTLTCLGNEAELVTGGRLSRMPLSNVAKIAEPRDPVWEGPVIGAGLGVLFWALCGSGCDDAYMARATIDYALIGLLLDAASSNNKTIYRGGGPAPALSFRVRF